MSSLPLTKLTYLEVYVILACILSFIFLQTLQDGQGANTRRRIFLAMVMSVFFTIFAEATVWILDDVRGTAARRVLLTADALDTLLTPARTGHIDVRVTFLPYLIHQMFNSTVSDTVELNKNMLLLLF